VLVVLVAAVLFGAVLQVRHPHQHKVTLVVMVLLQRTQVDEAVVVAVQGL
jgi:hypothetical protein